MKRLESKRKRKIKRNLNKINMLNGYVKTMRRYRKSLKENRIVT